MEAPRRQEAQAPERHPAPGPGNQLEEPAPLATRRIRQPERKTEKSLVEITRLAREITPRAIARLESIMDNEKAPYRDQQLL